MALMGRTSFWSSRNLYFLINTVSTRTGPATRALRCEQRFIVPKSLRIERGKGPTREPQRPFFRNDARGRHRLFCVKTKARCSDRLWARRCSIRKYVTNESTHPRLIPRVPCSQGSGRTALRIAPPVSSPNSRQLGRCGQAGLALGDGGALPLALASIDFVPSTPTASPQDVFATRRRLKAILYHFCNRPKALKGARAGHPAWRAQGGASLESPHVAHASRSDLTLQATYIIHHLNEDVVCNATSENSAGCGSTAMRAACAGARWPPVVATVPCARGKSAACACVQRWRRRC